MDGSKAGQLHKGADTKLAGYQDGRIPKREDTKMVRYQDGRIPKEVGTNRQVRVESIQGKSAARETALRFHPWLSSISVVAIVCLRRLGSDVSKDSQLCCALVSSVRRFCCRRCDCFRCRPCDGCRCLLGRLTRIR